MKAYGTHGEHYDDLEFVDDPLNRKKKVNEVINKVELDLVGNEDDSMHSESQTPSNQNTLDQVRKYVLKQQLKHELSKKRNKDKK